MTNLKPLTPRLGQPHTVRRERGTRLVTELRRRLGPTGSASRAAALARCIKRLPTHLQVQLLRELLREVPCLASDRLLLQPAATSPAVALAAVSTDDLDCLSLATNRLRHGHEFGSTTQGYLHRPDEFTKSDFSRIIRQELSEK